MAEDSVHPLQCQSMTSVALKSPLSQSSFSMVQETPHIRTRQNIWDKNSDANTNADELEQTVTNLRKNIGLILSPDESHQVFPATAEKEEVSKRHKFKRHC